MPMQNFHSARVADPEKFKTGKDDWATKDIAPGISIVLGRLKDGDDSMTAQAYRFDKERFTEDQAKAWLKKHDIKYILFEPAKADEAAKHAEEYAQLEEENWIEIFRAGDYPEGSFTEEQVRVIAESYDPLVHEAPITPDHKDEGPALGWIGKLKAIGKKLFAAPSIVTDELKQMWGEGKWRKISAEIYPQFMGTKRPYLRAVSVLGAKIPAVKGMAPAAFNEAFGKHVVIDFQEGEAEMTKEEIEALVTEKLSGLKADVQAEKTAHEQTKVQLSEAQKALADAEKKATEAETEKARVFSEQRKAQDKSFLDKLAADGKLVPAMRVFAEPLLNSLDGQSVVKFKEGDKDLELSPHALFCKFLSTQAKLIRYEEVAKPGDKKKPGAAKFRADGDDVVNVELRDRALAIMEERKDEKMAYGEALKIAREEKGE